MGEGTSSKLANFVARSRVSRWLTQQEEHNRFLVLEGDSLENGVTPWTK